MDELLNDKVRADLPGLCFPVNVIGEDLDIGDLSCLATIMLDSSDNALCIGNTLGIGLNVRRLKLDCGHGGWYGVENGEE